MLDKRGRPVGRFGAHCEFSVFDARRRRRRRRRRRLHALASFVVRRRHTKE